VTSVEQDDDRTTQQYIVKCNTTINQIGAVESVLVTSEDTTKWLCMVVSWSTVVMKYQL